MTSIVLKIWSYWHYSSQLPHLLSRFSSANCSLSPSTNTDCRSLPESDRVFEGGALGNYSLAGFEMVLVRHVMHYIINYYLPSGLFVVVSWISFLVPAEVLPGKKEFLVRLSEHASSFPLAAGFKTRNCSGEVLESVKWKKSSLERFSSSKISRAKASWINPNRLTPSLHYPKITAEFNAYPAGIPPAHRSLHRTFLRK